MKKEIREIIIQAANKAGYNHLVDFDLDSPPKGQNGDFATNIALVIAGETKQNPRDIAQKISEQLNHSIIKSTEVAGPGFINIVIQDHILYDNISQIIEIGSEYGKSDLGKNKKVSVDFVSANPTGPLHIGNARGGPIGLAICNLLEFVGYKVTREFYVNDVGLQIKRLGNTFYYWYEKLNGNEIPFPEDGYPASYVEDTVKKIVEKSKNKIEQLKNQDEVIEYLTREGLDYLIDQIKKDLELLGIKYDKWVYESKLQESHITEKYINLLKEKNATVNREGALWLQNDDDPNFKDKESVLVKSDAEKSYTYFADDIAYHMKRYENGEDLIVDVWGANHHGHIARMNSALKALGINQSKLNILLYQYIRIVKDGQPVKMGKRLGNFVTLKEVLDEGVSADAFKYFILSQNTNTPFDFDIKLAADQSEKNPVYYIQYAHARICSILKKAQNNQEVGGANSIDLDFSILKDPKELALLKELAMWPDIVVEACGDFQMQSLPQYAYKIAMLFHDFYTNCPILTSEEETKKARLALISATKIVISNLLSVCGISAPESM